MTIKLILAIVNVEREKKDGGDTEKCVWTTNRVNFIRANDNKYMIWHAYKSYSTKFDSN